MKIMVRNNFVMAVINLWLHGGKIEKIMEDLPKIWFDPMELIKK